MSKGNIIFLVIMSLILCFSVVLFIQGIIYPQSSLQEMRPVAVGKFMIHRDCYNVPTYSIDANSISSNQRAIKMDNRNENVWLWDLKENSEYRVYVRQGILRDYYFVECMN